MAFPGVRKHRVFDETEAACLTLIRGMSVVVIHGFIDYNRDMLVLYTDSK